jgi:hypothetical protein
LDHRGGCSIRFLFYSLTEILASCKIHFEAAIFPFLSKKYLVAQAFQPVPTQAEACGYIILQKALKAYPF